MGEPVLTDYSKLTLDQLLSELNQQDARASVPEDGLPLPGHEEGSLPVLLFAYRDAGRRTWAGVRRHDARSQDGRRRSSTAGMPRPELEPLLLLLPLAPLAAGSASVVGSLTGAAGSSIGRLGAGGSTTTGSDSGRRSITSGSTSALARSRVARRLSGSAGRTWL